MQSISEVTNKYSKIDDITLTHEFQDSCIQDKEFMNYVYGLNAKEELLIQYTSRLEDSFAEYKNCQNCKGLSTCKNHIKGYSLTAIPKEKIIDFSYVMCNQKNENDQQLAYQQNLSLYEMPMDIKNASFKDMYKDDKARVPIVKYFKEFINNYDSLEKPKGVYLNGSFGSGKTYLVAALFNELAKKNIKSALIYYPEFLGNLKSAFQNGSYDEQMRHIKKIPLLLFDDIGAENCSNWSRDEVLGPILQYRMENHLPTFFTSNLTIEELEKSLSTTSSGVDKVKARRIIERIKQLTIQLELISKNRRN